MSIVEESVRVVINSREYKMKCTSDETDSLMASAALVNEQMNQVRQTNPMATTEQQAVVVALNMAKQALSEQKNKSVSFETLTEKLRQLTDKIEKKLDN